MHREVLLMHATAGMNAYATLFPGMGGCIADHDDPLPRRSAGESYPDAVR
jgi:hypothetical protein